MVGGGGILLIIFLFTLPFYSSYGFTFAATSSPASIWGIFALILTLVVVADWGLALFSPETQLPTSPLGRELTRASLAAVVVLFLVIKLLLHTGYLGWGCFVDIIVALVVVYGAWMIAQGKSTPVKA
jgi:hypothetical protein